MIDEGSCADPSSQDGPVENNEKEAKRAARERERNERRTGKLTDLTYDALATGEKSVEAMVRRREVVLVKGTKSQFDARTGKLKTLMPPVTCDCCQTFSTLSAVLLSSLVGGLSFCTSTINYLLYIAAWLHQISMRRWPQGGVRPTVGDLNHALHLKEFFPSKVMESEFEVVFYNQRHRALDLVQQLCSSTKRPREEEAEQSPKPPICGYVIVSGDYTVSIFSVLHPTSSSNAATSSEEEQWTFYIGDSHGTQPWSLGKASLCGITFTQPRASSTSKLVKEAEGAPPTGASHPSTELLQFCNILFTILEEHRQMIPQGSQVPYMTWTPIRRRRSVSYSSKELKNIVDKMWLPRVLTDPIIRNAAQKHNFRPLECFWGL